MPQPTSERDREALVRAGARGRARACCGASSPGHLARRLAGAGWRGRLAIRPSASVTTRSAICAIGRVVRDDGDARAEVAVHAVEHLEDEAPRRRVERAGRLVAEQDLRLLHDRARDGDPLLLAARHLRRVVVAPLRRARPARAPRPDDIGVRREVGDERDVLARREARDEVVELEDEADVLAPVLR